MSKLTASQAAAILHMDPETLRRYEDQGKLPFTVSKTKGGHRRYAKADVEAYLVTRNSDADPRDKLTSSVKQIQQQLLEASKAEFYDAIKPLFSKHPEFVAVGFHDQISSGDGGYIWFSRSGFETFTKKQDLEWQIASERETFVKGKGHVLDEVAELSEQLLEQVDQDIIKAFITHAGKHFDAVMTKDGDFVFYDFYGRPISGQDHVLFEELDELVRFSENNWSVARFMNQDPFTTYKTQDGKVARVVENQNLCHSPIEYFCYTEGIPRPNQVVFSISAMERHEEGPYDDDDYFVDYHAGSIDAKHLTDNFTEVGDQLKALLFTKRNNWIKRNGLPEGIKYLQEIPEATFGVFLNKAFGADAEEIKKTFAWRDYNSGVFEINGLWLVAVTSGDKHAFALRGEGNVMRMLCCDENGVWRS